MHSYNTRFQAKAKPQQVSAKQVKPQQERNVGLQSVLASPLRVRHQYPTRFERKRIQDLVIRNDCTAMKGLIAKTEAATNMKDKIVACIDLFIYLRDHRMLFRMQRFKETILKKIDQIELDCYEHFMSFERDGRKNICRLVTIMHELRF